MVGAGLSTGKGNVRFGVLGKIAAVSREDVVRVAGRLLASPPTLTAIGPLEHLESAGQAHDGDVLFPRTVALEGIDRPGQAKRRPRGGQVAVEVSDGHHMVRGRVSESVRTAVRPRAPVLRLRAAGREGEPRADAGCEREACRSGAEPPVARWAGARPPRRRAA